MGKWLLNIEASLWASLNKRNDSDALHLLNVLENIPEDVEAILFREEIYKIILNSKEIDEQHSYRWLELISRITTREYPSDPKARYLQVEPDVTANITDENYKSETRFQVAELFNQCDSFPIHVISPERINDGCDKICVSRDKKKGKEKQIHLSKASIPVEERINALKPKLYQLKHHQFEHTSGKGKVVSVFSAWDTRDTKYAEQLLQEAFYNYKGTELPAKYLYIYDSLNQTYVQFRCSRNNLYHGLDIPASEVPDEYTIR